MYKKIVSVLTKHMDKVLHFTAGMVVCLVLLIPLACYWALLGVAVIGFAKEVRDKVSYGRFDWLDWLATVAGGLFVLVCLLLR